ncbi:MAG: ankyrin repeat domain-containing protein [Phycisphaerae bacterium]|nr:ankyrin repeat domain-containing protein [Phycisphaerae bacterium]
MALLAVLALPQATIAAPPHPGWDCAAADLQTHWQRRHPDDKIASIKRVPTLHFHSEGGRFEITYVFELRVKKVSGEKTFRVGAGYLSRNSGPYVFTGISEDLSELGDKLLAAPAVPLLDAKDARLLRAVKDGDLASVRSALAAGGAAEAKDEEGSHALFLAAAIGKAEIVRLLLAKGAQVNATTDRVRGTALMAAAKKAGHPEVVKLLLDKGAEVNATSATGTTALLLAQNARVVKLLLAKGARVDAKDNAGLTALMTAKNVEVAKLLLDKGAAVDARDGSGATALAIAAGRGHADVAKLLLEKGAEVDAKEASGRTPLLQAAEANQVEIVKALLGRGADVHAKDKHRRTSLIMAAERGYGPIAKLLLGKGADLNAKDGEGHTALMAAAKQGHLEIVRLLVDKGADVGAKDRQGRTAINIAAEWAQGDIVALLEEKGKNSSGASHAATSAESGGGAEPAGKPGLDAETCGDACALLTLYSFDELASNACKICKKYDDTFCEIDFPFNDVPSCDAYDELRNCIFARFGYVFSKPKWQKQFGKAAWYKPDPSFTEAKLPAVAKANVQKLKQLKAKRQGCQ